MASDSGRNLAPARRAKVLAAALVVVVCCTLSLAFIPSASAKRDHTTQPSASQPTQTSETSASTPTPSSGPAAANATPETGSQPPGRRAGAARESTGGQRSRHEDAPQQSSGKSRQSTAQAAQETEPASPAGSQATASPQSSTTKPSRERQTQAAAEPTRSRESAKRSKARSTQPATTSGSAPSAGPGTPTTATPAETAPASTPASAPAAAVATAVAPAPAVATPTLAKSTVQSSRPRAVHRSPRVRSHGHSRTADAAAPAPGALAHMASTLPAAAPARPTRRARASAHRQRPAGRPSPLVTSITRIVDVVPTAVRMLIAGLLALALALAVRSRVAALRGRRLERQRAQLAEDVGLLQAALLPVPPARLGPVGTSVAYQPAAGPGAGGDFYDVFALEDGQLAVIVGDVSGHGRQALPHTALVRFTLRAYLEAGLSPRDALQTAGAVLERQLGGAFATVVAATYQPRERVLVYACAGHPPPIVRGADADAGSLPAVTICGSPPIGVGMRTGTRQTAVSIPGNAQICFYTDGVTEARVGLELFGAERLAETLAELGPHASAHGVLAGVAERADARPDDMAACLLSVEGDQRAPEVLVEELELDRDEVADARTQRFLLACGVERHEIAEVLRSACARAGRAGTVVLELRRADGPPQITVRREQVAYLHARRPGVGVGVGVAL
jgi:serine phosphatase RsbU (regulator of sigma subunit)